MRKALTCNPRPPSLYCNLGKPHPLGVYIVHDRSTHVLSFVSLYFAVVYSDRAALDLPVTLVTALVTCWCCFSARRANLSLRGELYIYRRNRFELSVVNTIPKLNLFVTLSLCMP